MKKQIIIAAVPSILLGIWATKTASHTTGSIGFIDVMVGLLFFIILFIVIFLIAFILGKIRGVLLKRKRNQVLSKVESGISSESAPKMPAAEQADFSAKTADSSKNEFSAYDFIAIDFETANNNLNSACSVGIVAVKNQEIVNTAYYLIKPPTAEFSAKNISIHGITFDMVKTAEDFSGVWEHLKIYFENTHFVIAHNAQFDMSVLRCCLDEYAIDIHNFHYIDNINITHECSPGQLKGNSLQAAVDFYGVNMENHHNALSDAAAVANIIIQILKTKKQESFILLTALNNFKLKNFYELNCTKTFNSSGIKIKYTESTISMQELKTLSEQIIEDKRIEIDEIKIISSWIHEHQSLAGNYPFDKISELCSSILADDSLTASEADEMLSLLYQFVNPIETSCAECPINFDGKLFVLTGDFEFGSKRVIAERIVTKGGAYKNNITKKTDYLIVGGAGNDNWKFGNYGTKVVKALEMQENGHPILILKEEDLINCFE